MAKDKRGMRFPLLLLYVALMVGQISPVFAQSRGLLQERARFEGGRGDVFAVVVGISDYTSSGIRNLSYAHSDAQAFAAFLQSDQGGRVPSRNILLLVNEQATERAVRSALLDWLPEQASRKDHTVIVFFSGHGVVYRGNPMLLVRDTDASRMGGSSVPMDVVERAFNIIEAERKLFFVDACHSGAVREVALVAKSMSGDVLIDRLAGTGRIVMASSRGDQSSYESEALGAGFFTHYLLEGLKGAADRNRDGYVEVEEAFRYTYEKVSDAVVRERKLQNPRIKGEIEGVVLLSRVGGGESAVERARREAVAAQAERNRLARELADERERQATAQAQAEAESARQEALRLQKELEELRRQQQTVPSPTVSSTKLDVGEMVYVSDFGFYIDKYPVTNAQYAEFVRATGHRVPLGSRDWTMWSGQRYPSGYENHPVVGVSWEDANAYCEWAGKRLPTEKEWQQACQGTDGRTYPWGDTSPNSKLANYIEKVSHTTEVGRYPLGASPYGVLDMAGNVWEWTESLYTAGLQNRVVRGGSWLNYYNYALQCAYRGLNHSSDRRYDIGFRCARK